MKKSLVAFILIMSVLCTYCVYEKKPTKKYAFMPMRTGELEEAFACSYEEEITRKKQKTKEIFGITKNKVNPNPICGKQQRKYKDKRPKKLIS